MEQAGRDERGELHRLRLRSRRRCGDRPNEEADQTIGSTRFAGLVAAVVLGWSGPGLADDLAKASQNPVGDLISVPFEFSYYGSLPGESSAAVLLAKPVVPFNLGGVNLVNRLIVLFAWVDVDVSAAAVAGAGSCCQSMPWDSSRAIRRAFSARNLVSSSYSFGIEPDCLPENQNLPEYPDTNPRNVGFQCQGFVSEAALTSG